MNFKLAISALSIALCTLANAPVIAQETSTETATEDPLPTMEDKFDVWTQSKFSFEALISNSRRSRPDFQFKIDDVRYQVLFDAGRAKRNAILDCLELADECEIKGAAFMIFRDGKMKLNVTDITWLSIPPIDFDVASSRIHRCIRSASRKKKTFSSIVTAKLSIQDLEKRQTYTLEPITPREGGRGYDLVELAVEDCIGYRFRLPVGDYELKVYTQSGETFLDYWEE